MPLSLSAFIHRHRQPPNSEAIFAPDASSTIARRHHGLGRTGWSALLAMVCIYSVPTVAQSDAYDFTQLGWTPRAQLTPELQQTLPDFCRGTYVANDVTALNSERIEAEADEGQLAGNGAIDLQGDVVFRRADQVLFSDAAHWEPDARQAEFVGNVRLLTPTMSLAGHQAAVDDAANTVELNRSAYVIAERHLRGSARSVSSPSDQILAMEGATLTFCEPGENDWDIAAHELTLDQESGFGTAWHSRLRIAGVPVLYLPYYRFPIDDRRLTGFLDPTISINGEAQAEDIQIPFYLNLAPNLDATITAHHVLDHGLLWENQLRHKTQWTGDGEINYGFLNRDAETGEERSLLNIEQHGRWGRYWQHDWTYSKVSDLDYFRDMNPTAAVDRTTHLPQRGTIRYQRDSFQGTALLESFQTTDEDIALSSRPYRRLPQIQLNYEPSLTEQLTLSQTLEATRFNRVSSAVINDNLQTLSGRNALNGDRFASDTRLEYAVIKPYGFLTPALDYRHRSYRLYDDTAATETTETDTRPTIASARASIDGGLFFERETEGFGAAYTQTLEPRLFYVYSPYQADQELIPAFDTKLTSVSFNSLFTGDRFTGNDRLADLNQLSTGLTTRYLRDDGLEQLRASIGRIWYFEDRRTNINTSDSSLLTRGTSSVLADIEWNPSSDWSVFSFTEWDPYQNYARQQRQGVRFRNELNRMLSISSTQTDNRDPDSGTQYTTHQVDTGAFWSLTDRWAVFGRLLRDINAYEPDARRPESPILESLVGFEFQNCCWRMQLMYRETSPRDTSGGDFTTEKRYSWMFSFQLKGLTTLGSGSDDLLSESIYGYSRRQYHDY